MFAQQQQEQTYDINTGIVPITIKMLNSLKQTKQGLLYKDKQLQQITIVGRLISAKMDQNRIKVHLILNDDTGVLKTSYFVKSDADPIGQMMKAQDLEIDDYTNNYYTSVISLKQFKDITYYVLNSLQKCESNELTYHLLKVMNNEIQKHINNSELEGKSLEQQIELYIRHYQRVNLKQILKRFNCSVQQLRLILEQLKKQSIIMECVDPETFKIV